MKAPKLPRLTDVEGLIAMEEIDNDLADVRLEPIQERILLDMVRCTDLNWRMDRMAGEVRGVVPIALSRLELASLIGPRQFHEATS